MIKFNKEMKQIHAALDGKVRLVGGAVRDHLAGLPVKDYDFCTPYIPDVAIEKIWEAENDVTDIIKTGISHGTFTVVFSSGNRYEVTTLRMDKECDGRHAKVAFTDNYFVDASRRDFTYNAMSMDPDGTIYDYFGGAQDLKNGLTVFIGDPNDRIKEDYLRIMRFFRFSARFGFDQTHPATRDALVAIAKNAEGLLQVSVERIWSEMQRILNEPWDRVVPIVEAMRNNFVLGNARIPCNDVNRIHEAIQCFDTPETKLAALWPLNDVLRNAENLKWSKEQIDRALFVHAEYPMTFERAKEIIVKKPIKLDWILEALNVSVNLIEVTKFYQNVPKFPIKGEDVLSRGVKGKTIGLVLRALKDIWISKNYTHTRQQLLDMIE